MAPVALFALAEKLLLNRLLNPRQPTVKKSRAALALLALAVLFALAGIAFLAAAGYIWLESHHGAQSATLTMCAALLAISLSLAITGMYIKKRRKVRLKEVRKDFPHNVPNVLETLMDELGDTVRDHPKAAILAALAAGFMAHDKAS